MNLVQLEVLVEEPSMEAALKHLLPRIVPGVEFRVRNFQGKHALLRQLPSRLRGYADRIRFEPNLRIVVLIDADDEDCIELKRKLETWAMEAGLPTITSGLEDPVVVNRIAVEELEAWLLGDASALSAAYPRVDPNFALSKTYRDPDSVRGGTWEAAERLLRRHGCFRGGLAKIEFADVVARHMDLEQNRSASLECFVSGSKRLTSGRAIPNATP